MTPEAERDRLLERAREVVDEARRAEAVPAAVAGILEDALGHRATVEPEFVLDPASGVEALGFAVGTAGGVVLRLPDEYPDSFEPVTLAGHVDASAARRTWFAEARLGGPRVAQSADATPIGQLTPVPPRPQ